MTHNHQKNGYSKILGVTFVILILAAIVSGVYYFEIAHMPLPSFITTHSKPVNKTATYLDYQFNFSVDYPSQYKLDVSGSQPNYFVANGAVHADISIPQSEFPKTNFGSADMTLAAKNKTTLADCQTYVARTGKPKKMTKSVKLAAGTFYTDEFTGAAAGTTYDTKIYRIFHNDVCFESALTVWTGSIENIDPAMNIQPVNETDVWNDLSLILTSFKFTQDAAAPADTTSDGVIMGRVDIGPNCPVERNDAACATSPDAYEAVQIIVYATDRTTIVAKTNPDATGKYSADVPPGTYYVTYSSIYSFYQPSLSKVVVTTGKSSTQNFSIDTGIR